MKGGRSLLCFPLEFLRTLLANLVHTNDNDAAPLNVRTDAAPQFHPLEVDRHYQTTKPRLMSICVICYEPKKTDHQTNAKGSRTTSRAWFFRYPVGRFGKASRGVGRRAWCVHGRSWPAMPLQGLIWRALAS